MNQDTDAPKYKPVHVLLLLAPLIFTPIGAMIASSGRFGVPVCIAMSLFVFIDVLALFIGQIKYLRRTIWKQRLRYQLWLVLITLITPFLAIVVADYKGMHDYQTPLNGLGSDSYGLAFGVGIAFIYAYGCVIANELYIKHNGRKTGGTIIGKILYWLAYLIIAVVSWIGYGITYSLHDPSTE